jgi:hypothetical protein
MGKMWNTGNTKCEYVEVQECSFMAGGTQNVAAPLQSWLVFPYKVSILSPLNSANIFLGIYSKSNLQIKRFMY